MAFYLLYDDFKFDITYQKEDGLVNQKILDSEAIFINFDIYWERL